MLKANKFLAIIALFFFVVIIGSCGGGGGGSSTVTTGNDSVSSVIGPAGGTITTPSGNATLSVPSGALSSDTTITISQSTSDEALGGLSVSYEFLPDGLTFNTSVTISLKYDPSSLPVGINESELKLAYESGGEWVIISDTTVDTTNHISNASITHLSKWTYVYYEPLNAELGDFEGVIAYSNNHCDPTPPTNPYYNCDDRRFLKEENTGPDHYDYTYGGAHFTGEEWQCVEYISRYYWVKKAHDILLERGQNDATNFWDTADQRGLDRYQNGGSVAPQPGDIIVFEKKDASGVINGGHVAIVRDISGNEVYVIQQNWYLNKMDANALLSYDSQTNYLRTFKNDENAYKVKGWLRLPYDTTAPTTPVGLTATAVSSSQIDLSWNPSTDNVGVAGYKIYDYYGTYLNSVTSTSTSIIGLNPNTYYCFTVSAYDAAGNESGQSSQACATTLSTPDTTPPSVPTNLNATAISSSQINLSWNASPESDVAGYKIYRNGSSTPVKTVSGTSTSDTGLSPSTQYCYRVTAYDTSNNESGLSNEACATTNSEAVALIWKKSGVWTGNQSGPQDAGSHFWNDPLFDDSSWSTVTLPDSGSDSNADGRYYRAHFTWDGVSLMSINFISDDGLAIYINGNLLGSWGNGWRQPGCINKSSGCSINTSVLPQTIPISMLNSGDNVMSVDLWNGAICCDYYLDITVNVIEECWPCEPPYCPPECM